MSRSFGLSALLLALGWTVIGQDVPPRKSGNTSGSTPGTTTSSTRADDSALVEAVISARKSYQEQLLKLYDHYLKSNDRERARWVAEELRAYHLAWKPSYRLDIQDVPPVTLPGELKNEPKANELFKQAMEYKKARDTGNAFILNQRRAELLLQEIVQQYRTSDKIADVAYELGDLYEGKAFQQYDRAALYFERAYQWRSGSQSDARLRAARLYDRVLNERSRAIELYREERQHDGEPTRLREAEKRLGELTGNRKR